MSVKETLECLETPEYVRTILNNIEDIRCVYVMFVISMGEAETHDAQTDITAEHADGKCGLKLMIYRHINEPLCPEPTQSEVFTAANVNKHISKPHLGGSDD